MIKRPFIFSFQVSAATSVSLGFFTAGLVRAWASPAVPSMQGSSDVEISLGNISAADYTLSFAPMSKEELSWICKSHIDLQLFFHLLPATTAIKVFDCPGTSFILPSHYYMSPPCFKGFIEVVEISHCFLLGEIDKTSGVTFRVLFSLLVRRLS